MGDVTLDRYVWRKTRLVRPNVIVDQVPLNTQEVIGADILFVTPF